MIKYLQLPLSFDITKMQAEVVSLGEKYWQLHFQVKHYEGNWSAIPLRSIGGDVTNGFILPEEDVSKYLDTVLLAESPYLKSILDSFLCPLYAVRLLKLTASTKVHTHKDQGLHYEEGLVRIHIPIVTNTDVEFILENEPLTLLEGSCWYLNLALPHSLHNKSNTDRIHLVIDAAVNDWVKTLFESKEVLNKKVITPPEKFSSQEKLNIIAQLRSMNTEIGHKLADEMEAEL